MPQGHWAPVAEGVGFEPTRPVTGSIGFQDRRLRPLGHPSGLLSIAELRLSDRARDRIVSGDVPWEFNTRWDSNALHPVCA